MLLKSPLHFDQFNKECLFISIDISETPFMEKLADLQFSFLNVDSLYFRFKFYFCKDKIIISNGLLDYCEKHSKTMCQQENKPLEHKLLKISF